MIILEKDEGVKINFELIGTDLHLGDAENELVLALADLQQEWDEHITVFFDKKRILTLNERKGRSYVAEIDIPALTYMASEDNPEEAVPAPIDVNLVTLTLWAIE